MAWAVLLLAGLFEIGFTTAMKASEGFTRPIPSVLFAISAVLSFWLLTRAVETLPLGTAYAVWVGIGAVGTVLVGVFVYGEAASPLRIFFIGTLIASIIGLKFVSE